MNYFETPFEEVAEKFAHLHKKDIGQSVESTSEKASDLASCLNLGYIETSALTGENVEYAFFTIAKSLYDSLQ